MPNSLDSGRLSVALQRALFYAEWLRESGRESERVTESETDTEIERGGGGERECERDRESERE